MTGQHHQSWEDEGGTYSMHEQGVDKSVPHNTDTESLLDKQNKRRDTFNEHLNRLDEGEQSLAAKVAARKEELRRLEGQENVDEATAPVSDDALNGSDLGETNAFTPEEAPGLSLIMLMRIYDVQLAILDSMDRRKAEMLMNAHDEGKIIGPVPAFTGFLRSE